MFKKGLCVSLAFVFLLQVPVEAKEVNEAETVWDDTLKYALIGALKKPIDQAIENQYRNNPQAPKGLTWAVYETDIIRIRQEYGVGGTYEITLRVKPYYRAHIAYGEDIVVVRSDGKLIHSRHVKTYPVPEIFRE